MGKFDKVGEKFSEIKLDKSWHYLCYIYLLLPGVLFLLALLGKNQPFAKTLGLLFHNYGLFVTNTVPNLSTFTGVLGLGLALWFLLDTARRRDWTDMTISLVLVACNTVYFLMGWNYLLAGMLVLG